MFCDPRRGQHFAVPFAATTRNRIGRIGVAVEDNDFGLSWLLRRMEPAAQPLLVAMVFETLAPMVWPVR